MYIETLKKYIPFSELDDRYLEDALEHLSPKSIAKGEMLFKRGRTLGERFYLLSGRVDLIDAGYNSVSIDADIETYSQSLNPESPTRCSCVAKSPVEVFSIEAEVLDRIVAWSQSAAMTNHDEYGEADQVGEIEVSTINDEDASDWMSSLLQSPLFTKIPLSQVQVLFSRFEGLELKRGDIVIKEGEKGDYFYVLASGSARVTNRLATIEVTLEPGSYFGEEALLGKTPRNATIEMLEDGLLKRLTAADFESLLKAPILEYLVKEDLDNLDKPYKVIDVKTPIEFRFSHVSGSINVPLARLRSSLGELAKSSVYVVPDDAGSRADIAAHLLCQAGFEAYILSSEPTPG